MDDNEISAIDGRCVVLEGHAAAEEHKRKPASEDDDDDQVYMCFRQFDPLVGAILRRCKVAGWAG